VVESDAQSNRLINLHQTNPKIGLILFRVTTHKETAKQQLLKNEKSLFVIKIPRMAWSDKATECNRLVVRKIFAL
jgi:hypothetical protein